MRAQVARSMNSKAWRAAVVAAVSVGCLPAGVRAEPVRSGVYRAAEGPDVASWLEIRDGGRFRYVLSAGALDEQAEGRWQSDGDALLLYTEPKPVPPEFVLKHMAPRSDAPFSLTVSWPDGGGIAGVEFRIGYADGTVTEGYTQEYGWTQSASTPADPVWLELYEPIHRISPRRFDLARGTGSVDITLVPHDIGVVDFTGNRVWTDGDTLFLGRDGGAMRFKRQDVR